MFSALRMGTAASGRGKAKLTIYFRRARTPQFSDM